MSCESRSSQEPRRGGNGLTFQFRNQCNHFCFVLCCFVSFLSTSNNLIYHLIISEACCWEP